MRTRFLQTLTKLAEEDERITLIVGDLGYSVVEEFASRFPDRYINAGVAEQSMTGIAAGLAATGRIVFTYSIANFPTLRCLEQIRVDVCYHNLPVIAVAVGGGFAYGTQGYTHYGLEDIGIMRTLPKMRVYAPADPSECESALRALLENPGPGYLRLGRNGEPDLHKDKVQSFDGAFTLRDGKDALLLATGPVLVEALNAADLLKERGIEAKVMSIPSMKPFPDHVVLEAARSVSCVVTVEEHCKVGGLGSATAEALAEGALARPLIRHHSPEEIPTLGTQAYLRHQLGLHADALANSVERALR